MKDKILYFFPFIYFIKTRVPSIQSFVFHLYNEWIPAFVFILIMPLPFNDAIVAFLVYYLIFISFYELGYILNDHYSVKNEDSPRFRSKLLSRVEVWVIAVIRVCVFCSIVSIKGLWNNKEFIVFYVLLGAAFLA